MIKPRTKILVVEDEASLLDLYQVKLLQEGYEVFVAKNGEEGFDLAKEYIPDLVLLDILMPDVDGYAMLKKVKDDPKTKKVPVIIFSNLSQKEEIEKGLRLGARDFIIKTSVTPGELAVKVKEYLKILKK
jgi:DNA-binding response OmpR family regulator